MPDPPSAVSICPPAHIPDISVEQVECLALTVPAWFAREDFRDWRQGRAEGQWAGPASWLPQERTGDYVDVFMTFDCSIPPLYRTWYRTLLGRERCRYAALRHLPINRQDPA